MNSVEGIVWDVSPILFSLGSVEIRYYGLAWALTFAVGMLMFYYFVKNDGYKPKVFDSVFWYGVLSTIIGARLGHCLFYDPIYYLSHPWEMLYVWQGGLASHGAAIGLLIGLWMFSKKNRLPYMWSLDRIMLPVTIGGSMVRFGNLMNSEIYGVETDLPWGFIFANVGEVVPKHPTQLYEALCYLITFFVLAWLFYRKDMGRKRPGLIFGIGLIGVFLSRFFIEYVKNPQVDFEQSMGLLMGQWLSIPFIILAVWVIYTAYRKPEVFDPLKRAEMESEPKPDPMENIKSGSQQDRSRGDNS